MRNLLFKELKLWWHPGWFLFLLFGSFLLFPSWPFFIAFGYLFISFVNSFFIGRANQDTLFTMSLPVRKRDTVLARISFIAMMELLQILVAAPFAVINNSIYLKGNMAGMNTNFAFFGCVFIMYAVFNIIFFPMFYKTAYKTGVPMIVAVVATLLWDAAVEVAIGIIPALHAQLDGLGATHLASQLPVLLVGMLLFGLFTWAAYRISADRFEKVDL